MNDDPPQSYALPDQDAIEGINSTKASAKQRIRTAVFLLIILIGLGWVGIRNPLGHSLIPRCPTEQFAGFYCPGCGSTRATHHLLNARLTEALSYNPMLVFVGMPVAIWYLVRSGLFIIKGKTIALPHIPPKVGWVALVLLLMFTVARNLPVPWADALRPTTVEQDSALYEEKHPDESIRQ